MERHTLFVPQRPLSWLTWAAFVGIVLSMGCTIDNPNEQSGGDHTRKKALEMPLNQPVIDHVSVLGYDKDDWKFFTVSSPGLLNLTLGFDNPESTGRAQLINEVGQIISDLQVTKGAADQLRRISFQAQPGNYYLHVWAEDLETGYTVEVIFQEYNE